MAASRSAWLGAILAGWALLALASGAWAQPGSLDTTFGGSDGFVAVEAASNVGMVQAMAVDTQNRIVAVGRGADQWAVLRFLPDGTLDSSFTPPALGGSTAYDVAVDSQNRIVIVGGYGIYPDNSLLTVVRLTETGALDTLFGSDGIAQFAIDKGAIAKAVKIQPDGRIVVAGACANKFGYWSFLVARLLPDGSLDTGSFGTPTDPKLVRKGAPPYSGYRIDDFESRKSEGVYEGVLAVQPDGRILIGGFTGGVQSHWSSQGWTLIRYLPNGARDTGFGVQGVVTATPSCDLDRWTVGGLALQAVGSNSYILASGRGWNSTIPNSFDGVVVRYDIATGALDTGFGSNGLARTGLSGNVNPPAIPGDDQARQVAVDSQGRVILGGTAWSYKYAFRFTSSGTLDGTFGPDPAHPGCSALAYMGSIEGDSAEWAPCMTLDNAGRILVGGASQWMAEPYTMYLSIAKLVP